MEHEHQAQGAVQLLQAFPTAFFVAHQRNHPIGKNKDELNTINRQKKYSAQRIDARGYSNFSSCMSRSDT